MRTILLLIIMCCSSAQASSTSMAEESANHLIVEFVMPAATLSATGPDQPQQLALPGTVPRLGLAGLADLPFFAELVAAPPNATVSVEVLETQFVDYVGVDYVIAQADSAADSSSGDPSSAEAQGLPTAANGFWPPRRAVMEYAGIVRGVSAHALRLYPCAYDAQARTLRVYQRIRLAVHFDGGSHGKRLPASMRHSASALYAPFLNTPRYAQPFARVTAKSTQLGIDSGWYDPTKKWVKVVVEQESLHKIDRAWFEKRFLDVDNLDPQTLRLFLNGEEESLYIEGEEDGSFDETDFLLFFGRERHFQDAQGVERDHDSIYGRKNIYWLTWGGEAGKRFGSRSGAPVNDYPVSEWYWATEHFEFDLLYEEFGLAEDNERDHWFDNFAIAAEAGDLGAITVRGEIFAPYLEEEYSARLRIALHGASLRHHTVLKFNNQQVDDSIWQGQSELLVETDIPSTYINDDESTNRVLLQVRADQGQADKVYFNWFQLQFRRRYDAFPGRIAFPEPASAGRRITLRKFADPNITLVDVANGMYITDALVEPSPDGRYLATFEDAPSHEPFYVAADNLSMIAPRGFVDPASDWRSTANGADYLIITHDLFVNASKRLADHRRQEGLEVEIVNVQDIYDEFSGGQMDRDAIADFIQYAYHNWQRPPVFVLLMGDATYDYRNIIGGGKPSYVPSQYYHARGRGNSPSDFLYTLVDGDDLLPDLALGRLAVSSSGAAAQTVDRIIRYDTDIESGDWRSRVIYLANQHDKGIFTEPSNALARNYTEPFGLESVKIYNPENTDTPNATGGAFLEALNQGSLMVNFAGHGSANFMQFVFSVIPDWGSLGRIRNGRKLPLVLALSCLNGMFVIPTVDAVSEALTTMGEGGAIAYISASAQSFVAQNDLLSDTMYRQIFEDGVLTFGPTLNAAKIAVLAAHSSWDAVALTMQLFGDPAQNLALPAAADYTAVSIRPQSLPLLQGSRTQVELVVRNNTRQTADSLSVILLGFPNGAAQADTIGQQLLAGFVGSRTLTLDWAIEGVGGPYRLEAILDSDNKIAEIDEFNNLLAVEVEILEPALATPLFPPAGAVISAAEISFEALVPLDGQGHTYAVEFEVGTGNDFTAQAALITSLPVTAESSVAVYSPELNLVATATDYFWRARVIDGVTVGPWSGSQGFTLHSEEVPAGSLANERLWRQRGLQLLAGESRDLALDDTQGVQLSAATSSFHPDATHRESSFAVEGLGGAGIVCTDGTYLYAKRWFNDSTTVYPGVDQFARIGSGFNGTEAGRLYDFLPAAVSAGTSATYHSDGFLYNDNGNAFELERISIETGLLDTIAIPDGMLEWQSGLVDYREVLGKNRAPHFLITSDGRYIYNASMSSASGVRNGWGVRVFDPSDGWRLVREFTSPPTETGFTFRWTDGLLADGERLYLIEFDDGYRIRMIDAVDGRFLAEWESEQETTHSIAGQYDWINNKVWLGDLRGSDLYQYAGLGQVTSGVVTTDSIGPAHTWSTLEVEAISSPGEVRVDLLGEDGSTDGGWLALDGYQDMEAGIIDLTSIDATRYPWLRLRASLRQQSEPAPMLSALQVRFGASPSLRIAAVDHHSDDRFVNAQITVRNLSPFAVTDARVVATTDAGVELSGVSVASLNRGETRIVSLDSIAQPTVDQRLFARVETSIADANPADNVFEIVFRDAPAPAFSFSLWPDGGAFVSGDPVRAGQGILIARPAGVSLGELQLTADGQAVVADSLFVDGSALYRPGATAGDHLLHAAVDFDGQLYQAQIRVVAADGLTLANSLVYPNPVRGAAGFTYVLSHKAEVTVELFSLNGRLIRRLEPQRLPAGFAETKWDGRGDDGRQLANGTYLYRIRARDDDGVVVEHRAPFVVTR